MTAVNNRAAFGLLSAPEHSALVLLPVPWEATVSCGTGAAQAPAAILQASNLTEIYDRELGAFYGAGIAMLPLPEEVRAWDKKARKHAVNVLRSYGMDPAARKDTEAVNALSERLNEFVYEQTKAQLDQGKIVGLVGGDHSTPFGAIRAYAEREGYFGILHVDAHSDTRDRFEGFVHSHGSIMFNVARDIGGVEKIVQVGIRDLCEEEDRFIRDSGGKVAVFFDRDMAERKLSGTSWKDLCGEIIATLPKKVYISFDIDGLDPALCPHTGTPVPGGLSFPEALFLLRAVAASGRRIVGFDLVEVASGPDSQWDANVGARLLFALAGWTLRSQGKA